MILNLYLAVARLVVLILPVVGAVILFAGLVQLDAPDALVYAMLGWSWRLIATGFVLALIVRLIDSVDAMRESQSSAATSRPHTIWGGHTSPSSRGTDLLLKESRPVTVGGVLV